MNHSMKGKLFEKKAIFCAFEAYTQNSRDEREKKFLSVPLNFQLRRKERTSNFSNERRALEVENYGRTQICLFFKYIMNIFFSSSFFNVTLLEMTPILFFSPAGYARPIINNVSTSSWSATDYFLTSSIDDPCM